MASNNHNHNHNHNHNDNHGQVSNISKEEIILCPFTQNPDASNETGSSGHTEEEICLEKCWKPALARQHSWSNEDRKHQLQKRLQGPLKGRETGFTEAHSGDQNAPKQHLVL